MKQFLLFLIFFFSYKLIFAQGGISASNELSAPRPTIRAQTSQLLNQVVIEDSVIKSAINYSNKFSSLMDSSATDVKNLSDILDKVQSRSNNLSTQLKKDSKENRDLKRQIDAITFTLDSNKKKIEKLKNDKFDLSVEKSNLLSEKNQNAVDTIESGLQKYDSEISKYQQKSLLDDKNLIPNSDNKTQHQIDSIYTSIALSSLTISSNLKSTLFPKLFKLKKELQEVNERKNDLTKYPDKKADILSFVQSHEVQINTLLNEIVDLNSKFNKEYENYRNTANASILKIDQKANELSDKNKDDSGTQDVSTLGGINQILGDQGSLVPNITIIGEKKFKGDINSSLYGNIKLFVGGNSDNKNITSTNKLFVQESSTYGVMTNFVFGFISSSHNAKFNDEMDHYDQRLAINIGASYLGKNIKIDSLNTLSPSVFHLKLGMQLVLIPHVLSAYINSNMMLISTKVSEFDKFYNTTNNFKSFASYGIESYLDVSKKSDFHIYLNLGFINNSGDVKDLTGTQDKVIPTFTLSLVKNFLF